MVIIMQNTGVPRVSVIVPVYRAASYLAAGIGALLRQTFSDYELILVDDGSPDESPALCDAAAAQDVRVRVIHKPNGGAGSARNAGIDAARGEYLAFLDADDECRPEMLETLLAAADTADADIVVCGYQSFDAAGDRETVTLPAATYTDTAAVRDFFTAHFPLGILGYPWNKLYRRRLLTENAVLFPAIRRFEDGHFNLAAFTHARRVVVVPQVLYRYRINDWSGVFQKFPKNNYDLLRELVVAYDDWLTAQAQHTPETELLVRGFFLNELVGCIDCVLNPAWEMNHAARRAYLEILSHDEVVRRYAKDAPREGLSRYAAMVVRWLYRRQFTCLLGAVRLKLWLKRDCRRLFSLLKGV